MGSLEKRDESRAKRRALLIAGPTASGKSAVALKLAQRFGGTVVNTDSMQVYRDLRVLTARPSEADETAAPHELFGTIDGAVNHSVGLWLAEAAAAAKRAFAEGRPVLFVGGTGLYFRALTEGLSDIPAVPAEVRARVRAEADQRPTSDLHADLARDDPETAARLRPNDRQRVLRALEIFAATGRPLAAFQGARGAPFLRAGEWSGLFLSPDRDALKTVIDGRFDAMLAAGALDEVAALAARGLDPALPVMRAHGVPHLIAHLAGRLSLEEAATRGKLDTKQYAKRQFTWARHQMAGLEWVALDEAVETGTHALETLLAG
jgi:tRNA dimethylallyltransferase